ncbi:MAG: alpha/beta fold hydrolase [Proteobacteria bacterium]|nr:alpha/beta fold hydrolase [Pseudomonadota bacterium]
MDLNFIETGDGPALVILHGLFGSSRNWTSIAKNLGANYRVIAVDLPNHGASPWLDDLSYPAMADAVADFMAGQTLRDVTLLGHSMGGKTAMTLAHRHGHMLDALIVADIAPVAYARDGENLGYLEAMRAVPVDQLARRGDAETYLMDAVPDPGLRGFFLQNLIQEDGKFRWLINLEGLRDGMETLRGFPEPAEPHHGKSLFIAGGQSVFIRPHHNDTIREQFPNARIAVMEHAGHWLHAEDPVGFTEAVRQFLSAD